MANNSGILRFFISHGRDLDEVQVYTDSKLIDLKVEVEKVSNIPPTDQILIYEGHGIQGDNEDTMTKLGLHIRDGSTYIPRILAYRYTRPTGISNAASRPSDNPSDRPLGIGAHASLPTDDQRRQERIGISNAASRPSDNPSDRPPGIGAHASLPTGDQRRQQRMGISNSASRPSDSNSDHASLPTGDQRRRAEIMARHMFAQEYLKVVREKNASLGGSTTVSESFSRRFKQLNEWLNKLSSEGGSDSKSGGVTGSEGGPNGPAMNKTIDLTSCQANSDVNAGSEGGSESDVNKGSGGSDPKSGGVTDSEGGAAINKTIDLTSSQANSDLTSLQRVSGIPQECFRCQLPCAREVWRGIIDGAVYFLCDFCSSLESLPAKGAPSRANLPTPAAKKRRDNNSDDRSEEEKPKPIGNIPNLPTPAAKKRRDTNADDQPEEETKNTTEPIVNIPNLPSPEEEKPNTKEPVGNIPEYFPLAVGVHFRKKCNSREIIYEDLQNVQNRIFSPLSPHSRDDRYEIIVLIHRDEHPQGNPRTWHTSMASNALCLLCGAVLTYSLGNTKMVAKHFQKHVDDGDYDCRLRGSSASTRGASEGVRETPTRSPSLNRTRSERALSRSRVSSQLFGTPNLGTAGAREPIETQNLGTAREGEVQKAQVSGAHEAPESVQSGPPGFGTQAPRSVQFAGARYAPGAAQFDRPNFGTQAPARALDAPGTVRNDFGTQPYGIAQPGTQPYGIAQPGTQPYGTAQFGPANFGIQPNMGSTAGAENFSRPTRDFATEIITPPPGLWCVAGKRCQVSRDGSIKNAAFATQCSECREWMHHRCNASSFENLCLCPGCFGVQRSAPPRRLHYDDPYYRPHW